MGSRPIRWLDQRTIAVLVLDGTERLNAFPRLAVYPAPRGRWAACVMAAAGNRISLAALFDGKDQAQRACLESARSALPRRWHGSIDRALADLGAAAAGAPPALDAPPVGNVVTKLLAFARSRIS